MYFPTGVPNQYIDTNGNKVTISDPSKIKIVYNDDVVKLLINNIGSSLLADPNNQNGTVYNTTTKKFEPISAYNAAALKSYVDQLNDFFKLPSQTAVVNAVNNFLRTDGKYFNADAKMFLTNLATLGASAYLSLTGQKTASDALGLVLGATNIGTNHPTFKQQTWPQRIWSMVRSLPGVNLIDNIWHSLVKNKDPNYYKTPEMGGNGTGSNTDLTNSQPSIDGNVFVDDQGHRVFLNVGKNDWNTIGVNINNNTNLNLTDANGNPIFNQNTTTGGNYDLTGQKYWDPYATGENGKKGAWVEFKPAVGTTFNTGIRFGFEDRPVYSQIYGVTQDTYGNKMIVLLPQGNDVRTDVYTERYDITPSGATTAQLQELWNSGIRPEGMQGVLTEFENLPRAEQNQYLLDMGYRRDGNMIVRADGKTYDANNPNELAEVLVLGHTEKSPLKWYTYYSKDTYDQLKKNYEYGKDNGAKSYIDNMYQQNFQSPGSLSTALQGKTRDQLLEMYKNGTAVNAFDGVDRLTGSPRVILTTPADKNMLDNVRKQNGVMTYDQYVATQGISTYITDELERKGLILNSNEIKNKALSNLRQNDYATWLAYTTAKTPEDKLKYAKIVDKMVKDIRLSASLRVLPGLISDTAYQDYMATLSGANNPYFMNGVRDPSTQSGDWVYEGSTGWRQNNAVTGNFADSLNARGQFTDPNAVGAIKDTATGLTYNMFTSFMGKYADISMNKNLRDLNSMTKYAGEGQGKAENLEKGLDSRTGKPPVPLYVSVPPPPPTNYTGPIRTIDPNGVPAEPDTWDYPEYGTPEDYNDWTYTPPSNFDTTRPRGSSVWKDYSGNFYYDDGRGNFYNYDGSLAFQNPNIYEQMGYQDDWWNDPRWYSAGGEVKPKNNYAQGGIAQMQHYANKGVVDTRGLGSLAPPGATKNELYDGLQSGLYAPHSKQGVGSGAMDMVPQIKPAKVSTPGRSPSQILAKLKIMAEDSEKAQQKANSYAYGGPVPQNGGYQVPSGYYPASGYAGGGHLLNGPGDGMSDSIDAMITGEEPQRAALADGEFVVPADVVSHLGNGSTKAGADRLYELMDNIRNARTGTTEQAPQVNPNDFLNKLR